MPNKQRITLSGRKIAFIVNPRSAKNKWLRTPKLRQFFHRRFPGRVYDQVLDKTGMIELAEKLSRVNDVLIAFGGDGTLADVMQGIMNSGRQADVLLGIIPLGSGNAVCGSLQIPKQIRKAVKVLRTGRPRPIDLIEIGGQIANFVSIGATAIVTHKTSQSKVKGFLGHLLASRVMITHPRQEMEIELFEGKDKKGRTFDRKTMKLKLFDCIINKTNYFGYNWIIAPRARIDDGYLDITLFDIRAFSYLFNFPLIYMGHYQKILKHYKVKSMIVRGKDLYIQYNGEIMPSRDEIEIRVLPKALSVIVPRKRAKQGPPASRF
ncbi:MAG: diacylglycerol kinase family protein [Candidatus Aminicenantales bacterium]